MVGFSIYSHTMSERLHQPHSEVMEAKIRPSLVNGIYEELNAQDAPAPLSRPPWTGMAVILWPFHLQVNVLLAIAVTLEFATLSSPTTFLGLSMNG